MRRAAASYELAAGDRAYQIRYGRDDSFSILPAAACRRCAPLRGSQRALLAPALQSSALLPVPDRGLRVGRPSSPPVSLPRARAHRTRTFIGAGCGLACGAAPRPDVDSRFFGDIRAVATSFLRYGAPPDRLMPLPVTEYPRFRNIDAEIVITVFSRCVCVHRRLRTSEDVWLSEDRCRARRKRPVSVIGAGGFLQAPIDFRKLYGLGRGGGFLHAALYRGRPAPDIRGGSPPHRQRQAALCRAENPSTASSAKALLHTFLGPVDLGILPVIIDAFCRGFVP